MDEAVSTIKNLYTTVRFEFGLDENFKDNNINIIN
jgi:hypothetical protein